MMKIGFVIYGSLDNVSGGYLYDRKLVEYLRAQGDTVDIISLSWRNYPAHLTDNLRFRLPYSSVNARRVEIQNIEIPMKRFPNNRKFDLLIQDELNHPSLIGANRRGKHPYPIVSLVHHLRCSELRPAWQNRFYRFIEMKYLQSVDGFLFNSKTTKDAVAGLVEHGKQSIIAYPPTDRFGEAISETEIIERSNSDPFRILFLGNVIYRKGLHTLLKALSHAGRDNMPSYKLDVVGGLTAEPQYISEMERYISRHGLSSTVKLHGSLDNEPLVETLKQVHVLAVPSSYEGFGIAYLEGMGFGLPAIGTTAGAAGEIINDGVNGFLIEPENADKLAARLEILNEKRGLLRQMSITARARYLRQPTWERTAGQIRNFLLNQIREFTV